MSKLRSKLWSLLGEIYPRYLRSHFGMDIGENVIIARTVHLDKNINPKGIHIGDNTWLLRNAMVLAHDYCRGENGMGKRYDTYIGKNCVIGVNSIIMPGIKIGDHCIVAAGAVVTNDVPSHCIVAGNPAKVQKIDIEISDLGQIVNYGKRVKKETD